MDIANTATYIKSFYNLWFVRHYEILEGKRNAAENNIVVGVGMGGAWGAIVLHNCKLHTSPGF